MSKKTIKLGKAKSNKAPQKTNSPKGNRAPAGSHKKLSQARIEEGGWLDKILHPKKRIYLIALVANGGQIYNAADAAGISAQTHYDWLNGKADEAGMEAYREAFEEAKVRGNEEIVAEMRRRGIRGVRRLKFNSKTGQPYIDPETSEPYVEREYSDNLLAKLADAKVPEFIEAKKNGAANVNVQNNSTVIQGIRLYLPDNGRGDEPIENVVDVNQLTKK